MVKTAPCCVRTLNPTESAQGAKAQTPTHRRAVHLNMDIRLPKMTLDRSKLSLKYFVKEKVHVFLLCHACAMTFCAECDDDATLSQHLIL